MYWKTNNSGWNKSHEQVETTPRIDSYEVKEMGWRGCLFAFRDNGPPLVLDCCRGVEYAPDRDIESVELWHPEDGWSQIIEISRKENGFGGCQAFFLCPACGQRVRFLYFKKLRFVCRKCARLNYRSQQETRSDSLYFYDKGMALAEKHLEPPPFHVDGFGFNRWVPERPRYMHRTTYLRYLTRFLRYRERHSDRQLKDMAWLLRIFK